MTATGEKPTARCPVVIGRTPDGKPLTCARVLTPDGYCGSHGKQG